MAAALPLIDDQWILARRGPRAQVDPQKPYAFLVEPECQFDGTLEDVATIFITNKECPFRCLMCDLWTHTTTTSVPSGAIPRQIQYALERLPPAPHIKLYNAGNFFDAKAIPPRDLPGAAELVKHHRTVIIECHPRLISRRCLDFADRINGRLEVALGLETVDPNVLPRLNKRMTLEDFQEAARFLIENNIAVRAFILLRAPFQSEADGLRWAKRSIDFAFECGVECCVIIPTRPGNGAMDELQAAGRFAPPSLSSLEEAVTYGISQRKGRVFADLWDAKRFITSPDDVARIERLAFMNATQRMPDTAARAASD